MHCRPQVTKLRLKPPSEGRGSQNGEPSLLGGRCAAAETASKAAPAKICFISREHGFRRCLVPAIVASALATVAVPAAQPKTRRVTVDDLMKLRAIVDVQIAPDGQRVAYVVSTANLSKNEHEAELYVVPAGGGASTRLGETVHIFNMPTPRPQLRWSPDGAAVSLLGLVAGRPELFGIPVSGGTPEQLTKAPEGVFGYEWSPDGKSLAFITRDPMSADEERQRQDKSFVIHADAPDRATRLVVQRLDAPSALRL